jgi:hypothetical protein
MEKNSSIIPAESVLPNKLRKNSLLPKELVLSAGLRLSVIGSDCIPLKASEKMLSNEAEAAGVSAG